MRLGIADHFGWAVAVTVSAAHEVVDRRRIELVEAGISQAPIHYRSARLGVEATAALVADVRPPSSGPPRRRSTSLPARCHARSCRSHCDAGRWTFRRTSPSSVKRRTRPGPTRSCIARSSEAAHARGWEVHSMTRRPSRPSVRACWAPGPRTSCRAPGDPRAALDQGPPDGSRGGDHGRREPSGGTPRQASGSAAKSLLTCRYQPIPEMGRFHRPFMSLSAGAWAGVASVHHLIEMSILGLDHLVGGHPVVCELTRPTQLLTGHRLHARPSFEVSAFGVSQT